MLQAAGLGIGYRPKPVLAQAVANRLDHADLRGLLYAQGYTDADIIDPEPDTPEPETKEPR
jgi:phosphoserine phosphatase